MKTKNETIAQKSYRMGRHMGAWDAKAGAACNARNHMPTDWVRSSLFLAQYVEGYMSGYSAHTVARAA